MRKLWIGLLVVLFAAMNIVLFVFGSQNESFTDVSLANIVTMDITLLLSFFGVQFLIDKRRRVDFIIKKLDYITGAINDNLLFQHQEHDLASVKQRRIANEIVFVEQAVSKSSKSSMDKIHETFDRMRTYYGDHAEASPEDPFYEKERTTMITEISKVQMDIIGIVIENR